MAKGQKKTAHKPRNYELIPGLMRFSQARMFGKRSVYKKKLQKTPKKPRAKPELFTVKKVGGDKNGKERKVPKKRQPKALGPVRERKRVSKPKRQTKTRLRKTLTPGTVVIVLAGRHKGKRCVFLKQLDSGLLLITGPLKLNNCPLRRIPQCFVIATKTKLDIGSVKVPDHITDEYFKRQTKSRRVQKNKEDADLFATKKEKYQISDQRKSDQKALDKQILDLVKKSPEKKLLFGYLGSSFSLRKNQFPHKMIF